MKFLILALLMLLDPVLYAQPYQEKVVAAVLVAEASSEGVRGMKAVAEVIRQRSRDTSKTPLQVVTKGNRQRRAFSCLNGKTPDSLYRHWCRDENYGNALKIAATLVHNPQSLGNSTYQATHYTRKREKPYWARGKKPVAVIGQHAFYKLSDY